MRELSDCFLDIPDEGAETEFRLFLIYFVKALKERLYTMVVDYRNDGRGQRGPRVGTVVGLSLFGTASLDCAERCETTAVRLVKNFDDVLVMSLVVGY